MAAGGAAGALALTAAATAIGAKWTERRHPPAGSFITVDGVRLHVVDRGSGPAIVLLHGNGVDAQDFLLSGVVERLATTHRVIVFDRPGFGYSQRPRRRRNGAPDQGELIHLALEKLGVTSATIVGHSWGTLVAVSFALDYPDNVAGLVLLSGYYFPSLRLDVPAAAFPAIPIVGDIARYTVSPILGRLMVPLVRKLLFSPAPVADSFRAFPLSMSLRPWVIRSTAAEAALMVSTARALERRYTALRPPIAIMAGDGDKLVSHKKQSSRLAERLPNATFQSIHDAGHMIHHIDPALVSQVILHTTRRSGR